MSATATPIYKHYLHRDQQPSISKTTRKRDEEKSRVKAESKLRKTREKPENSPIMQSSPLVAAYSLRGY